MDAATQAKIELAKQNSVSVSALGWQGELTRTEFEQLIDPLVKKTLLACRRALKDAEVEASDVHDVVMVGGSTRTLLVREKVEQFFWTHTINQY